MTPSRKEIREAATLLAQGIEAKIGHVRCVPGGHYGAWGFMMTGYNRQKIFIHADTLLGMYGKSQQEILRTEVYAYALERFFLDPEEFTAKGLQHEPHTRCIGISVMMLPKTKKLIKQWLKL